MSRKLLENRRNREPLWIRFQQSAAKIQEIKSKRTKREKEIGPKGPNPNVQERANEVLEQLKDSEA
tara:strand:- start:2082 stop:2279 length:198 start_codon:yes stop_codon:yes gene_type:complete